MPQLLNPISVKFTEAQKHFLKMMSLTQQHGRISTVLKQLVDREMKRHESKGKG